MCLINAIVYYILCSTNYAILKIFVISSSKHDLHRIPNSSEAYHKEGSRSCHPFLGRHLLLSVQLLLDSASKVAAVVHPSLITSLDASNLSDSTWKLMLFVSVRQAASGD